MFNQWMFSVLNKYPRASTYTTMSKYCYSTLLKPNELRKKTKEDTDSDIYKEL